MSRAILSFQRDARSGLYVYYITVTDPVTPGRQQNFPLIGTDGQLATARAGPDGGPPAYNRDQWGPEAAAIPQSGGWPGRYMIIIRRNRGGAIVPPQTGDTPQFTEPRWNRAWPTSQQSSAASSRQGSPTRGSRDSSVSPGGGGR